MDGFGQPAVHLERAAELEIPAVAFTEHGNVTSHVKLEKHAKEQGIKPIFGCELYTGGVGEAASQTKWHLTALAMNGTGLQNLNAMVSEAWAEGFYYEPTVSWDNLVRHNEGLIILSGCTGSKLATDLVGGKGRPAHAPDLDAATETARRFKALLGDRYYLEMQTFPELANTRSINEAYVKVGKRLGIDYVATGDVHYPFAKDNEMQLLLHAIDRGGKGHSVEKQAQGWEYGIPMTMFKDKAILAKLVKSGLSKKQAWKALQMSSVIASRIDAEIPKLQELRFPTDVPPEALARRLVNEGWKYRGFDRLGHKEKKRYQARVRMEWELIVEKGFLDYFLVVGDMVRFAKDSGIPVGPARGSAAASLI